MRTGVIAAAYSPERLESFKNRLMNNIYAFSGAKSYDQLQALRDAVYTPDGKVVPWSQYKEIAREIDQRYNLNYLSAERDAVIAGTDAGMRWEDIMQTADIAPILQYVTAGDDDVREEHALLEGIMEPADSEFWENNYPPNGWNCRCGVRTLSTREAEHLGYKPGQTAQNMKIANRNISREWRKNTGTGELISTRGTITDSRGKQLKAQSYGMDTVRNIYDKAREAMPSIAGETPESYWGGLLRNNPTRSIKSATGLNVHFTDELYTASGKNAAVFGELEEVIKKPSEVWQSVDKAGKEVTTKYIKYYSDGPVAVIVDKDMTIRSISRANNAEELRTGILIKR